MQSSAGQNHSGEEEPPEQQINIHVQDGKVKFYVNLFYRFIFLDLFILKFFI